MSHGTRYFAVKEIDPSARMAIRLPNLKADGSVGAGAAGRAAESFNIWRHGDIEWSEPLTFVFYDSELGPEVARFAVERHLEPEFTAREHET